MGKVDFEEASDIDRLFKLLNAQESSNGACEFRSWEILREIERQQRRREYDRKPERIAKRIESRKQQVLIDKYITEHPEETKQLAEAHGLKLVLS